MEKTAKIFVAGHRGLVGSAIVRKLIECGYKNLILKTSQEVNLVRQEETERFFETFKPEYVFVAAAKVGGIIANRDAPTEFLYDNLMISMNVMNSAAKAGVKKLMFLGSSCVFPKFAPQPIKESALLTGALEVTNEAYAIAKIAGLKLAEYYKIEHHRDFISVMPPNLYGPGDNFHPDHSHVIPGLIRRFHEAKINKLKEVVVWGTGTPLREFLYVDDIADGCVFLMENFSEHSFINLGSGEEVTIKQLAETIKDVVDYKGRLTFDSEKPDGTPRKIMDSSRARALGWKPTVNLHEGLKITYEWYLENV
jgi:GDP-L-fucose synthase